MSLWLDTLRALAEPRRAIPIALVALPLLLAQGWYGNWHPGLMGVATSLTLAFLLIGPWAWRFFLGEGRFSAPRLMAYGLCGLLPTLASWVLPRAFGSADSFLTEGVNLLVVATLFWVGGWGLGRDIELERGFERERLRADALAREAERARLLAAQAHLDPHFLFNTLNALAEWTREDPEVAERGILQLSALLREVLSGISAPRWSLRRELELVRGVWGLHQLRDPEWFQWSVEVEDDVLELEVPPMILLPVVENAVKHGPARGRRGRLELLARRRGSALFIEVKNPGRFTGERPGGQGLEMVRRRLLLTYRLEATFSIAAEGEGTRVELVLPPRVPA